MVVMSGNMPKTMLTTGEGNEAVGDVECLGDVLEVVCGHRVQKHPVDHPAAGLKWNQLESNSRRGPRPREPTKPNQPQKQGEGGGGKGGSARADVWPCMSQRPKWSEKLDPKTVACGLLACSG